MSTITFKNGKTVNFDGTPSPDDIDEVATKMGITPDTPPQSSQNILQKGFNLFMQPIENTAVRAGESIADLGLTGINKITGGALDKYTPEGNLSQALTRSENTPMSVPFTGAQIKPISQETPESIAGNAVSTVALGLGNPTLAGGAIGAGSAMQDNKGPGETLLDTAASALGGKILELGFNAVTPLISKAIQNYGAPLVEKLSSYIPDTAKNAFSDLVDKINTATPSISDKQILPKPVSDVINKVGNYGAPSDAVTQVQKARQNVADVYEKTMPFTPTELRKESSLLDKTGDNTFTTLAKYGVNPVSPDAQANLQQVSDQFANATQHAQANEHAYFNLDQIKANAFDNINKNIPSETSRETAKLKVENEIDALTKANKKSLVQSADGQTMINSDLAERLRRTGNSWTPFNATDPEKIGTSTGYALSNAVRDQVEKQGTFPAYREANKEWGKVIHAQEMLQKIEGSGKSFKVLGGLSGSISRKVLSGVFGLHTGGLGGLVLSEMGSEYGAQVLSNPELRTYFDRAVIERLGNREATPAIVKQLTEQVENHINAQKGLLQLPAPRPLGSPENPHIMGGPTTYEEPAKTINRSNGPVSKIKIPKVPEPYIPDNKLPVIDMGSNKPKKSLFPTIR